MKRYDPTRPLIFIHVPKSAGSSVRTVFERWFGTGLIPHYFDEPRGLPPPRSPIAAMHTPARPLLVYGHFNRLRGFGVDQQYPEARQFITILRDPFETAISSYYYLRREGADWRDQSRVPKGDLRRFLLESRPNILNHFPREVTRDNYRDQIDEFFVAVGTTERVEASLRLIAEALGRPFEADWLPFVNATRRDQEHPQDLRAEYAQRYRLEFEVYEHVAARLDVQLNGHAIAAAMA